MIFQIYVYLICLNKRKQIFKPVITCIVMLALRGAKATSGDFPVLPDASWYVYEPNPTIFSLQIFGGKTRCSGHQFYNFN